eukprot:233358-Rhodomonas_salina.2
MKRTWVSISGSSSTTVESALRAFWRKTGAIRVDHTDEAVACYASVSTVRLSHAAVLRGLVWQGLSRLV